MKVTLSKAQLNTPDIPYEKIEHPSLIRNPLVLDCTSISMQLLGVPIGLIGLAILGTGIPAAAIVQIICGYQLLNLGGCMFIGGLELGERVPLNFNGEDIREIDDRTTEDDLIQLIKFKNRIFKKSYYYSEVSEVKESTSDIIYNSPNNSEVKETITKMNRS